MRWVKQLGEATSCFASVGRVILAAKRDETAENQMHAYAKKDVSVQFLGLRGILVEFVGKWGAGESVKMKKRRIERIYT